MILKPDDPNQLFFTSRTEMVIGEELVRTIDEVVMQLDLKPLYNSWSEKGRGFYDPAMMLKVLFYAYCDGERSSRRIAKGIKYDIRYQYFTGSLRPGYRTINRFRNIDIELLALYFAQIVSLCEEMGLLDTSIVAIDGTKIKAKASKRRTYKKKDLDRLAQKYEELLAEDAALEEEETAYEGLNNDEVKLESTEVEAISDRDLKTRVREAKQRLESGESEVNLTDMDARFMKNSEGGISPSFNGQIMVDKNQLIVAAGLVNDADDTSSFQPMVEQGKENIDGQIGKVLVDGGYYSGDNLKYIAKEGLDVYLPTGKGNPEPESKFSRYDFIYDEPTDSYICPAEERLTFKSSRIRRGLKSRTYRCSSSICRSCRLKPRCTTARHRELNISEVWEHERAMKRKLDTRGGRKTYDRRKTMVEPVFGNLKFNLGFTRFALKGLTKAKVEFLLMCIAHNLKKVSQCWGKLRPALGVKAVLFGRIFVYMGLLLAKLNSLRDCWKSLKRKLEYAC